MPELSPAAKEVRLDISKIWRRLQFHCKVDYCPRNPWPITIQTDPAGLEAAINDLVSAALRSVADQVASPIPDDCTADVFNRQLDIRAKILAIATELRTKS